jgi:hypothetical protein
MSQHFVKIYTVLLLVLGGTASAGNAGLGKIKNVNYMPNGVVIFYFDGARSNAPACATEAARFAINGATSVARVQIAGLLSAYTSGKLISVYGTGTCAAWGDTESVDFFHTSD